VLLPAPSMPEKLTNLGRRFSSLVGILLLPIAV
jgi:hypothetical protein